MGTFSLGKGSHRTQKSEKTFSTICLQACSSPRRCLFLHVENRTGGLTSVDPRPFWLLSGSSESSEGTALETLGGGDHLPGQHLFSVGRALAWDVQGLAQKHTLYACLDQVKRMAFEYVGSVFCYFLPPPPFFYSLPPLFLSFFLSFLCWGSNPGPFQMRGNRPAIELYPPPLFFSKFRSKSFPF